MVFINCTNQASYKFRRVEGRSSLNMLVSRGLTQAERRIGTLPLVNLWLLNSRYLPSSLILFLRVIVFLSIVECDILLIHITGSTNSYELLRRKLHQRGCGLVS